MNEMEGGTGAPGGTSGSTTSGPTRGAPIGTRSPEVGVPSVEIAPTSPEIQKTPFITPDQQGAYKLKGIIKEKNSIDEGFLALANGEIHAAVYRPESDKNPISIETPDIEVNVQQNIIQGGTPKEDMNNGFIEELMKRLEELREQQEELRRQMEEMQRMLADSREETVQARASFNELQTAMEKTQKEQESVIYELNNRAA